MTVARLPAAATSRHAEIDVAYDDIHGPLPTVSRSLSSHRRLRAAGVRTLTWRPDLFALGEQLSADGCGLGGGCQPQHGIRALLRRAAEGIGDPLERPSGVLQQSRVRDKAGCTALTTTPLPPRRIASSWVKNTRASIV